MVFRSPPNPLWPAAPPADTESDLAELGCDAGGCGDGCGGGNMDCDACTGEGDDIIECCGTCNGTNVIGSAKSCSFST